MPTKTKSSKPIKTSSKPKPSESSNSSSKNYILIALLIIILAIGANFFINGGSSETKIDIVKEPQAKPVDNQPKPPAPSKVSKEQQDAIDYEKMKPKTEFIEGVEVHTLTLTTADENQQVRIVGETEEVEETEDRTTKILEWSKFVNNTLDAFEDNREPTPKMKLSDDKNTQLFEKAAIFVLDQVALSDFMAMPHTPHLLNRSPTLNSLSIEERKKAFDKVFHAARHRIALGYDSYMRIAQSFRDLAWAVHHDFGEMFGVSAESFIEQTPMERAMAAKDVPHDSELLPWIQYNIDNHLMWEVLNEWIELKFPDDLVQKYRNKEY